MGIQETAQAIALPTPNVQQEIEDELWVTIAELDNEENPAFIPLFYYEKVDNQKRKVDTQKA